jgi:uncharacterized DUF497 family protein
MGTPTSIYESTAEERTACVLDVVYTNVYFMLYTWDPSKSDANLWDRGFDFEFATLIFEDPTLEKEDQRRPYGEKRVVAVGVAEHQFLTVVFTDRVGPEGDVIRRIISARRSSKRERQAYRKAIKR